VNYTSERGLFPNKESFNRTNPTDFSEGAEFLRLASPDLRVHNANKSTSISAEEDSFAVVVDVPASWARASW